MVEHTIQLQNGEFRPSDQRKEVDDASLQPRKPDENASSCDSRSARQKEVGNTSSSDADLEKRPLLDEIIGYVQEIPIGFKFKPKDHVIIGDYLRKKVANCPLPIPSDMIQDISASDFYKKHPKDIVTDVLDQREWFFYIKRDGIKFEDYKIREVVDGVGNWQPLQPFDTSKSSVQDLKGETIGYKLSFRFFRKSAESSKRTHWKMDVYELTEQDTEWAMARVEKGIEYKSE